MKLCVFGASGRTGKALVRQALDRGHTVTAFCRNESSHVPFPLEVRLVWGDLLRRGDVDKAVAGADAVVCLYGQRPASAHVFCAEATGIIIQSMKALGVKRLLCVTGAMIGDYPANRSPFIRLMRWLFRKQQPGLAADREQQEGVVTRSGLAWTIVKPPRLTEGRKRGGCRAGEDLRVNVFSRISREDLVAFILDELGSDTHVGKRVVVEY